MVQAAIYSLAGSELTADEQAFFRDCDPAGYILFGRNCVDQEQLLRLTDGLRSIAGRDDVPIMIDQEGGRVARMKPPAWPAFPPGEAFARLYRAAPSSAMEAARSNARALALALKASGINVNCLPLLDVRQEGASDIIGDRALGDEPMQVAALGRAVLDGMASAGVVGVVKHMPGHGRALVDSHKERPVIDASDEELAIDLQPFERLREAPMGMIAHLVYTAWDAEQPASLSPTVIQRHHPRPNRLRRLADQRRYRHGRASGRVRQRGRRAWSRPGCDVALHCTGDMAEMIEVAAAVPAMSDEGTARLERAMATAKESDGPSFAEAVDKRDQLLALA